MPAFLQSDDEEETFGDGLLSGVNVRRRRRQYDERMDEDDVDGDDVSAEFFGLECHLLEKGNVAGAPWRRESRIDRRMGRV